MAKYNYTFEEYLICVSKTNAKITFAFDSEPPINPNQDDIHRAEIYDLVISDIFYLDNFVDLLGDDPNTAFNNFITLYL